MAPIIKACILLSGAISCVRALSCYRCDGVSDPGLCSISTCSSHEVGCYVQKNFHNSKVIVYAKCVSSSECTNTNALSSSSGWLGTIIDNDHSCCRTDNCNSPSPGLSTITKAQPICYVCNGESDPSQCMASQKCPSDQDMCFIQVNRDDNGKVTRYARCMASSNCRYKTETWSRAAHFATDVCEGCCWGNNCNKDMCIGMPPTSLLAPGTLLTPGTLLAPHRLKTGISCSSCSGGDCGHTGSDPIAHCPDTFPYCMSTVENDSNGNQLITKRCASESDCEKYWWQESSTKNICSVFNPTLTYKLHFSCSYCCLTSECNKDVHPSPNTLYMGKLMQ